MVDAPPPVVGIIMGSQSDWATMRHASEMLARLAISHETRIVSAHRTPERLRAYAFSARDRGLRVVIAGAGGAAHLPGMCAAWTSLPVLGVPVESHALKGVDSLLSIAQMPAGIPVGTLAIGEPGAVERGAACRRHAGQHRCRPRRPPGRLARGADERGADGTRSMTFPLPPNATIGIVGGGQLGRMSAMAAARLGYRCHVLTPDDDSPGCPGCRRRDAERLRGPPPPCAPSPPRSMSSPSSSRTSAPRGWTCSPRSSPCAPSPATLRVSQDRLVEKAFLNRAGVPTAPWEAVRSLPELEAAVARIGLPAVLKTTRLGYDGKGQVILRTAG